MNKIQCTICGEWAGGAHGHGGTGGAGSGSVGGGGGSDQPSEPIACNCYQIERLKRGVRFEVNPDCPLLRTPLKTMNRSNKQSIDCKCFCHIIEYLSPGVQPIKGQPTECTHCEPISQSDDKRTNPVIISHGVPVKDRPDLIELHKWDRETCTEESCKKPQSQSDDLIPSNSTGLDQSDDSWQSDFDEKFPSLYNIAGGYEGEASDQKNLVKVFISDLLSKQRTGDGKLTNAEKDQMRAYIEVRQREGWYHGNKEHFEKREKSILEKLLNQ